MTTPYRTPLDFVDAHSWTQLGTTDRLITCLPLMDRSRGGFAHLTYRDALAVAAREGAELPTRDEILELHRVGLRLLPVILPDAEMLRDNPRLKGETERAYQTRIREPMASQAWCDRHDGTVLAKLSSWTNDHQPVSGAGKHWLRGAPPGRAYLMGWHDGRRWIQSGLSSGPGPHDDMHHDYATTTILTRPMRRAA